MTLRENIEQYRLFRNLYEAVRELRDINRDLILVISNLSKLLSPATGGAPLTAYPAITGREEYTGEEREQLVARRVEREVVERILQVPPKSVYALPYPVELVDATRLTVPAGRVERYQVVGGDLVMLYSPDDRLYYSPRPFSSAEKGAIPLPENSLLVFPLNPAWRYIYLMRETSEGPVYVVEWSYARP